MLVNFLQVSILAQHTAQHTQTAHPQDLCRKASLLSTSPLACAGGTPSLNPVAGTELPACTETQAADHEKDSCTAAESTTEWQLDAGA